jgi:hypothetical protein
MDTAKSDFVKALERFWNSWASAREDILLIVCGSAASWLVKKIVRNHGGLHNRLTFRIKINPFTLNEVQQFLMNRGIQWEEDMIAECYMSLGGIPYYLDLLSPALSLAQNMDALFFNDSPLLETEFQDLYASLFKSSGDHIKIVKALSAKRQGLTRNQIIEATGMSNGGSLTNRLDELEQCGFIRTYRSLGEATEIYQLVDFYTIFYFTFIHNKQFYDADTWMPFRNLQSAIPLTAYNEQAFLKQKRTITFSDDSLFYAVRILSYRVSDDISPLEVQSENIRALILNHRKTEALNRLRSDLLKEAEEGGHVKRIKK